MTSSLTEVSSLRQSRPHLVRCPRFIRMDFCIVFVWLQVYVVSRSEYPGRHPSVAQESGPGRRVDIFPPPFVMRLELNTLLDRSVVLMAPNHEEIQSWLPTVRVCNSDAVRCVQMDASLLSPATSLVIGSSTAFAAPQRRSLEPGRWSSRYLRVPDHQMEGCDAWCSWGRMQCTRYPVSGDKPLARRSDAVNEIGIPSVASSVWPRGCTIPVHRGS